MTSITNYNNVSMTDLDFSDPIKNGNYYYSAIFL